MKIVIVFEKESSVKILIFVLFEVVVGIEVGVEVVGVEGVEKNKGEIIEDCVLVVKSVL